MEAAWGSGGKFGKDASLGIASSRVVERLKLSYGCYPNLTPNQHNVEIDTGATKRINM